VADHGLIHLNLFAFATELHWILSEVLAHDRSNALDLLADRSARHGSPIESLHLETDLFMGIAEMQGVVGQLEDLRGDLDLDARH
jgi:hypothetical protein